MFAILAARRGRLSPPERSHTYANDNVQGYGKTANQEQDDEYPVCSQPIVNERTDSKCRGNNEYARETGHTTNLTDEASQSRSRIILLVVLGHLSLVLDELVHYITTSMCDNSVTKKPGFFGLGLPDLKSSEKPGFSLAESKEGRRCFARPLKGRIGENAQVQNSKDGEAQSHTGRP